MKQSTKQEIVNFLNQQNFSSDIDWNYFILDADFEDLDELYEHLEYQNAFDIEIIYYSNAIDFLANNDPSLNNSLELASDLGFEVKNLSSELLASLLASDLVRSEFNDLRSELEDIIDEN